MTPSLFQNTCGVGVAQVQSHGTAMLLAHHLSVKSHKHDCAQGRSQHEFPAVSLCSLQVVPTSQERRRVGKPLSLTANVSLLKPGHLLELPTVQSELGIMQMLTALPRSWSCSLKIRTVRTNMRNQHLKSFAGALEDRD